MDSVSKMYLELCIEQLEKCDTEMSLGSVEDFSVLLKVAEMQGHVSSTLKLLKDIKKIEESK